MFYIFWSPPSNFPVQTTLKINKGESLSGVAEILKESRLVKSELWFKFFVKFLGGAEKIDAGDYFFEEKENVFTVARRLIDGEHNLIQIKVTIPEGYTNEEIAANFAKRFSLFNKKLFLEQAEQGKMFPDTYFFLPNVTAQDVINRLQINFDSKIEGIRSDIETSKRGLKEILIMASILEKEANTQESRKEIADILWRRLKIGMALQVDAAPITYKESGLPNEPISNPGLEAILGAIYPIKNDYLYYLHDNKGNIYYAKTFEEHQRNRELYFKR